MFYEKLAEKRKTRQEQASSAVGATLGALAARGSTEVSRNLAARASESLRANQMADEADVRRILDAMGAEDDATYNTKILRAKDGRRIRVHINPNDPSGGYYDGTARTFDIPGRATTIGLSGRALNRDTFFHELGHATGAGSRPLASRFSMGARGLKSLYLAPGSRIAGQLAAGYAGAAQNKQQADSANSAANAAVLTSGLLELPQLAEEARASIRANALAKKFTGKGVNKANLLRGYGTYVASALSNTAPALVAKGIAKYKQRKYRDEKTASRTQEEPRRDPLLAGMRMYGGGALGAAFGAGAGVAGLPTSGISLDRYGDVHIPDRYMAATLAAAGLGAALGTYGGYRYHKAQQRKKHREER